jgi:hypothetical protein
MRRYRVKIRGRVFLWGSAGISLAVNLPLLLSIRVDEYGDPVTFGYWQPSATDGTSLGILQPGETYTLKLSGDQFGQPLQAVYATSDVDTCIDCTLIPLGPV